MKTWMYTPLLSVVALLLLAGCAAPPGATQPFPLLNAALTNSPPPELQAELRAAEERLAQRNPTNGAPEEPASAQAPAPATPEPAEEAPTATAQPAEEAPAEQAPAPATPEPAEEAPAATAQPVEEAPAEQAPAPATPETAEASAPEAETATVTVRNARVNIRQGPGLNYTVLTTAPQGTTFTVLGRSPDRGWWRICCIQGPTDSEGAATAPAWISNVVVTASAAAQDAPTFVLLPDDLQAEWAADYECLSDRCAVPACTASVQVAVRSVQGSWLELDRTITWDGECGENASIIHQVDRFTGEERNRPPQRPFAFDYWKGAAPGPATHAYRLDDGREIQVNCQEGLSGEAEEGGGWTTVYEGSACYDVRTGMMATLSYTKKWLFTGEYEGQSYDRAFFGDTEVYELELVSTNAELAFSQ